MTFSNILHSVLEFMSTGLVGLSAWEAVVYTLVVTHITIASVTIYLHRHSAHRSLDLHPIPSHFFRFWLWMTTGMVTKEWTAIHRKHHAKCETVDDPHSPVIKGLSTVLRKGAELYREEAQNPANHLGTVVRLDRDGRAPADNPFVNRPGAAPEVYSLGHRNPQGIAVDAGTGELLLTEHGARGGDEINRIVAGKNYGWPLVTAGIDYPFGRVTPFSRLAGFEAPLLEWTPSVAPSGLAVYDGALFPEWRGDLLVPALRGRALHRVVRDGGRIVGQQTLLAELNQRLRDVKVGRDGAIYVLTDGLDARLLRLRPPDKKPAAKAGFLLG